MRNEKGLVARAGAAAGAASVRASAVAVSAVGVSAVGASTCCLFAAASSGVCWGFRVEGSLLSGKDYRSEVLMDVERARHVRLIELCITQLLIENKKSRV